MANQISEITRKSLIKSLIDDSQCFTELRKSLLLDEEFEYSMGDEEVSPQITTNHQPQIEDYPTLHKVISNERDEYVSAMARKNRKTHEMEIHNQIRTALMNCQNYENIEKLLSDIKTYECKVKFDGDGHPYNLDDVVKKIYKDNGEELLNVKKMPQMQA